MIDPKNEDRPLLNSIIPWAISLSSASKVPSINIYDANIMPQPIPVKDCAKKLDIRNSSLSYIQLSVPRDATPYIKSIKPNLRLHTGFLAMQAVTKRLPIIAMSVCEPSTNPIIVIETPLEIALSG